MSRNSFKHRNPVGKQLKLKYPLEMPIGASFVNGLKFHLSNAGAGDCLS